VGDRCEKNERITSQKENIAGGGVEDEEEEAAAECRIRVGI